VHFVGGKLDVKTSFCRRDIV